MRPRPDVVVVTRNSATTVERVVKAAWKCRILLVDNGSFDGTVDVVRRMNHPDVVLILNEVNVGFGRAANMAAARSHAPYLLFANPDSWFDPDLPWLLTQRLENHHGAWAVGPRLVDADEQCDHVSRAFPRIENALFNRRWIERGGNPRHEEIRRFLMADHDHRLSYECDWVSGALFLARTSHFRDLGGFDESFFLYYEDVDLFKRAAERGWRTLYAGNFEAGHVGSVSARQEFAGAGLSLLRSFLRYYRKWLRKGLSSDLAVGCYLARSLIGDLVHRIRLRRGPAMDC